MNPPRRSMVDAIYNLNKPRMRTIAGRAIERCGGRSGKDAPDGAAPAERAISSAGRD